MHYTQGGGYNAKYGYSPSESTARKTVQSCTTSHKKATAFAQAATPTPFYRANDVNTSNLEDLKHDLQNAHGYLDRLYEGKHSLKGTLINFLDRSSNQARLSGRFAEYDRIPSPKLSEYQRFETEPALTEDFSRKHARNHAKHTDLTTKLENARMQLHKLNCDAKIKSPTPPGAPTITAAASNANVKRRDLDYVQMCNQQLSSEISGLNNEVFRLQRKMEEMESSREMGTNKDRVSSPAIDTSKLIRPLRCVTEESALPVPPRRPYAETPTGASSGHHIRQRGATGAVIDVDREFSESRVIIREPEVDSILRYIESIEIKLDDPANENRDLLKYFWNERFSSSTNLIRLLDNGKYLQALVSSFKLLNDFVTLSAHLVKKHDADLVPPVDRSSIHHSKRGAIYDTYSTLAPAPPVQQVQPAYHPHYRDPAPYFIQAPEQIAPLRDRSNSPFDRSETFLSGANQHNHQHHAHPSQERSGAQHVYQQQKAQPPFTTCSCCQDQLTDTSTVRVVPQQGRRTPSPVQNHPDRSQTHSLILPTKAPVTREGSPGRATATTRQQPQPPHREAPTGKYASSPRRLQQQQQRQSTPSPSQVRPNDEEQQVLEYTETKDALAALRSNIQALNRSINSKIGPVAPGMRHSDHSDSHPAQVDLDEVHMATSPKQAPVNTSVMSRDLNPKSESVLVFDHLRRAQAQSAHAIHPGARLSPHCQHHHVQPEAIIEEDYPLQATATKGKNAPIAAQAASTGKKNGGVVSPKLSRYSHGRGDSNESAMRSGSATRSSKIVAKKTTTSAAKPRYNGKAISNAPERVLHLEDIPRRKKAGNVTTQSSGAFYDIISGAPGKEARMSPGKEGAERDVSPGPCPPDDQIASPVAGDCVEPRAGDESPEREEGESSSPEFSKVVVVVPAPSSTKHAKSIKKPLKSSALPEKNV